VAVLTALVEYFLCNPSQLPEDFRTDDPVTGVVTYVGGMTDRFAFDVAEDRLGFDRAAIPRGIGRGL